MRSGIFMKAPVNAGRRAILLAAALAIFHAAFAHAAAITPEEAVSAAAAWLGTPGAARRSAAAPGAPLAGRKFRPSGAPSGIVRSLSVAGNPLLHIVSLSNGGFIAVSADSPPGTVVGFSASGDLPGISPNNPFWALVGGEAASSAMHMSVPFSSMDISDSKVAATARAAARSASSGVAASPDDLRIPPLVESEWGQTEVNGQQVFNLLTPDNVPCGCVATALAQLMRFHSFPTYSVQPRQIDCYKGASLDDGNPATLTTTAVLGGKYDWDAMPLKPASASLSQEQTGMLARIAADAAVAMRSLFTPSGSAAFTAFAHDPLIDIFCFACARSFTVNRAWQTLDSGAIQNGILANLDAGYPVLLGLMGPSAGGHAVLADGYGYSGGTLFCHLNMGWDGSCDLWYAIPEISAGGYEFTVVDSIVYNIFPEIAGELATGRVLDEDGEPVAGASVTAVIDYEYKGRTETVVTNVATSATGHYAVFAPAGKASVVSLEAAGPDGSASGQIVAATSPSTSPVSLNWGTGEFYTPGETWLTVGNSWGNDLRLTARQGGDDARPRFTRFSPSASGGWDASISGTPGAEYSIERSPSLATPTWTPCGGVTIPDSGSIEIELPAFDGGSMFFRLAKP